MSSKDRDSELSQRPREKRHRSERKEKDEDRKKDKDKTKSSRDRDRDGEKDGSSPTHRRSHKSSKSSKSRAADGSETHSRSHRRHRTEEEPYDESETATALSGLVPELARGMSTDRLSMPYPTFSKQHSKEFVQSREDVSTARTRHTDPLTPEPTDLGSSDMKRSKSADLPRKSTTSSSSSSAKKARATKERPPTPPDTEVSSQRSKRRSGTPLSAKEESGGRRGSGRARGPPGCRDRPPRMRRSPSCRRRRVKPPSSSHPPSSRLALARAGLSTRAALTRGRPSPRRIPIEMSPPRLLSHHRWRRIPLRICTRILTKNPHPDDTIPTQCRKRSPACHAPQRNRSFVAGGKRFQRLVGPSAAATTAAAAEHTRTSKGRLPDAVRWSAGARPQDSPRGAAPGRTARVLRTRLSKALRRSSRPSSTC